MNLETSNYWDNFLERANKYIRNDPISLDRLTVHITSECNLRCKYCNVYRSGERMPTEVIFKIIKEYSEMGGKIIHFTGGEPTIVDNIGDIINEAHKNGLKVSINTNAVKPIVDISKISKLKCSFDGFDLDVLCGVPGVYERICETLKYYNDKIRDDQVFSITCILSRKNYCHMIPIIEFVREHFPNVYNIYFSVYKGKNLEFLLSDAQVDFLVDFQIPKVSHLFTTMKDKHSKKQIDIYERNDFITGIRFPENNYIPCYLQLSELTIGVDCKIYNCSHLYRDKNPPIIGLDIRKNSLSECFLKAKQMTKTIPLSKDCLIGCNRNLCNFNKYVHLNKEKTTPVAQ